VGSAVEETSPEQLDAVLGLASAAAGPLGDLDAGARAGLLRAAERR
jgi:hypothetical protein